MTSTSSHPPSSRRRLGLLLGLALLVVGSLGAFWWPQITSAATRLTESDPVTAAWEKAKAAGSYHFTSDVLQETIPVATITNVGRSSRTDAFYLVGQNDLRNQTLELTLWNQGGSALNAESGVSLRTEDGKTYTRRGQGEWQATDTQLDAFAPQGDFLGYLAAIRNVSPGESETRNGITFTRYTFELDGPAFANYMHEQLTAALRAKGELPSGMELEPLAYYQAMTGNGELWVGTNGLPLRQILKLRFPEQKDERVEASMTVDFARYGVEQSTLLTLLRTGQWQGAWLVLPARLPDLTGLWLGLIFSTAALTVVRYRRLRTVQIALVTAVIVSQIVGPVLGASSQTRFFDNYRAKAAVQEEKEAIAANERAIQSAVQRGPEFNPHQNPLEAGVNDQALAGSGEWEIATQAPNLTLAQAPALQTTDPGTDTDGDTLTDFVERRIDTSPADEDTDGDALNDNLEVVGFTLGGQNWYLNPNAADSNFDGQSDGLEWGENADGTLLATPQDTDGDGLPDLFDLDNDNDGVPDAKDISTFSQGGTTFGEDTPLQLTLNNLTAAKPAMVEFQLRPQDAQQLWFAYNVLDWPQDDQGQIQDVDQKTYANVARGRTPDLNEANGDMKLLPMLEIRIPAAPDGHPANLPPQADLTPFNITVNDFSADGQTKVAYVPLSLVTDEQTGQRVAFSGQMRYLPTGSWLNPHQVRLAWVVEALIDRPCNFRRAEERAQGCQFNGYRPNISTVVHSYYSDWTLTGLNVHEEHGTETAIIYEDPTADDNLQDDPALWALAFVLDGHFVNARDVNADNQRDLTLADFPTRFDRDNNPTPAQRFEVPNLLQVERQSYSTVEQASAFTVMTDTVQILNQRFAGPVSSNRAIRPLLLFAQESRQRAVGLDMRNVNGAYVSQNGTALSLDMAPSGQLAQEVSVTAAVKWQAYCAPATGTVIFTPCTTDGYWDVLAARYGQLPSLPDDEDPAWVGGRLALAQVYYLSMQTGYLSTVQTDSQVLSSRYSLEDEDETVTAVRASLLGIATVPSLAAENIARLFPDYVPGNRSFKSYALNYGKTLNQYFVQQRNIVLSLGLPKEADKAALKPAQRLIRNFRLAKVGAGASVVMVVGQIALLWPGLPKEARATIGAVTLALTVGLTVVLPALNLASLKSSTTGPKINAVKFSEKMVYGRLAKVGTVVGSVVSVLIIWGFFAYAAATSGLAPGDPALIRAGLEAALSTIITILLFVLASNPIGALIAAIVGLIDLILTLVCELGTDSLRQVDGLDGACFTLTTAVTKALVSFLYNYNLMIDVGRDELMVTGSPQTTLADPGKGYVVGNSLDLTLPITTTIVHKDPKESLSILYYLYYFSADNLKSSTFRYNLSRDGDSPQAVDLNQMTDQWQNVQQDHLEPFLGQPMYRGQAGTTPTALTGIPFTTPGINVSVPFTINMNFAVPAYECWFVLAPVCVTREYEKSTPVPINSLAYDILPDTLTGFLAMTTKPDGGQGLSWDARFPSLRDADGDGLLSRQYNGLDPNDANPDSDNDGLSDRLELEQRTFGVGFNTGVCDSDNDGLADPQEVLLATNPGRPDSDNDGLADGEEVRHLVYNPSTCQPTTTWAGGWQVTLNNIPATTVWVSSDPLGGDSDGDSISDPAERQLATSANALDNQAVPYHPQVFNTPVISVFTASSDFDGYVASGQSFHYTSTVIANQAVAPGILNVTASSVLSGTKNPLALAFDPLNFSGSQTVTQQIAVDVAANATSQNVALQSSVNIRLPGAPTTWTWDAFNLEAPFPATSSPLQPNVAAATARWDTKNSYLFAAQNATRTSATSVPFVGTGDVWGYGAPDGQAFTVEQDNSDSTGARDGETPGIACNRAATCMLVWSEWLTPTNPTQRVAMGRLINANKQPIGSAFTLQTPITNPNLSGIAPVVSSDGVNFLTVWEESELSFANAYSVTVRARLYDPTGTALTAPLLGGGSYGETSNNSTNSFRKLSKALVWAGNRYRLVMNVNNNFRIVMYDIDANGNWSASSPIEIGTATFANTPITLAYNPKGDSTLVVYQTVNADVVGKLYLGNSTTPAVTKNISAPPVTGTFFTLPQVAYHRDSDSWLVTWRDSVTHNEQYTAWLPDLSAQRLPAAQTDLTALAQTALACPVPEASPIVDLRFEDLPGAPSFADSTGNGFTATCDPRACPTAGYPGAPGAQGSDYAVRMNTSFMAINAPVRNNFTVAMWVKLDGELYASQPTGRVVGTLVDNNANSLSHLRIVISKPTNGDTAHYNLGYAAGFASPNQIIESNLLTYDQWHLLALAVEGRKSRFYVDGVRVFNNLALEQFFPNDMGPNPWQIGPLFGDLDQFQVYPAALDDAAALALYNNQAGYCVSGGVNPTTNQFNWSKISLTLPDPRGSKLSASGGLTLTVDSDLPTASINPTVAAAVAPGTVIAGTASDPTSGVVRVEVSVNNGPWQPANGADLWTFSLAGLSGAVSLRARAIDAVGQVSVPSAALDLTIDDTPPTVSIAAPSGTIKPTKNASGRWQIPLTGTASDNTGLKADSILVQLTQTSGVGVAQTSQVASGSWNINYLLDPSLFDPTGSYSVTVQADDNAGNRTVATPIVIRLDAAGPVASLNAADVTRQVITQSITIGGVISDSNSLVGIDKLEIGFTPIEKVVAVPPDSTSDQADALLNRTWLPVTLAQRGAGVVNTTWSAAIPADLENEFQIDLRGTDMLGNVAISANLWRGTIDTRDPRVVMQATASGASYFDAASNQQLNEIRFLCAIQDRYLDESSFVCPGEGLAEPVRSFDNNPALQALFPDLTIRTGLAISYTLWLSTTTPAATARGCDAYGRCAQASTGGAVAASAAGESGTVMAAGLDAMQAAAAVPGAPVAVIVNPTNASFVSASSAVSVTVAAEAGAGLKDVTIKLDNAVVQTLSFAQSPAVTRTLRTVNVPVANEGAHTLVAQATAWDNSTQATLFPVVFTLDQIAPSLTIDASALTLADTWAANSGILRFNGNASDSVGLAAVQIREGNNEFMDATFGNGTWRVALPVADPEGRSLNITVRAIDRAGRATQLNQAIATDLSAADAPDTTISSGPANPSSVNTAQFIFAGSATAAAFECQIDNAPYAPCVSPASYGDLSKGSHLFRVRAIDSRGLPDLSPAEYTWTVNAGQPDATITGKPTNPTTERTATFTFSGDATATRFECSLDGGVYAACTSPKVYNNLGNGEHTFLVRARNSANQAGAADRYVWTVTNVAPVANSQTVIVIPNQAKGITLTATDNEPLLYTIVTPPAHGVLTGLPPNVSYSPDTNYGGPDSFTFQASDGLAESNVATVTIFVDNVPPMVTCSVVPNNLWPPNHKLISIQATVSVSDLHSGPAGFTLVSVTSSEADAGLDSADVPNDIQNWVSGTPDVVGQLRAERSDAGNGRTYTLTYEGKDLAGNKALCTTTVTVPKNQGGVAAATYDENQLLPDAYIDAQPAPADPVVTPVSDAPATDAQPTGDAAQTLKLFLPLVTNEAVNQ